MYLKFFHIICESVEKNQLFHINEHQTMKSPFAFYVLPTISPYVPHYNTWPWCYASVVRALFIAAMRPCHYRSWWLFLRGKMCTKGFYLSAFSMGTCACRWQAHVVNQWQREQSKSARENRRTRRCCRSSVNTCPLQLNQVFEMCIRAHVSHDDAIGRWCRRNRDRNATRDEKKNLSLPSIFRTSVILTRSIYGKKLSGCATKIIIRKNRYY